MAAQDWTACIAFTLAAEGGFVNDPRDPGGATNYGITLATLAAWRGPNVITTVEDVRALTPAKVTPIYHAKYWETISGDSPNMAPGIDLMVFDMGVNAGIGTSGEILQRCLGFDGVSPGQEIDGAIGPHTLLAVKGAHAASLITSLSAAQLAYYQGLSGWPTFGQGWSARVSERTAHANALALGTAAPPPPKPTWLGQIEGWAARFL